jgi:sulfite reductase (NADPH) hemoprotein beta-component
VQFLAAKEFEFTGRGDRYGWVEGVDGHYHLTCFIENGRILDYPGKTLKSGCKAIAQIHSGEFRMTANQNLVIAGVTPELKDQIDALAKANGLMPSVSNQRKDSMACVSLPTCPLAMAEAERYLPDAVTEIESMLTKHGIPDESIIYRVTGCPNGCGRAMLAEVGLVGKGPGKYNLHLGGNKAGTRIPKMYKENITDTEIMSILDELIGQWAQERLANECFGDYVIRAGVVAEVVDPAKDFYA